MRFLLSLSLFKGASSALDLVPMQSSHDRPLTVAKAVAGVVQDYPGLRERSREIGMRDALASEIQARHGGAVELPPAFRSEVGPDATAQGESQRMA